MEGLIAFLPELLLGLVASLRGVPNLSLGNVLGANIANLSLVIGAAAIIGGRLKVTGEILEREVFYAFLAGAAAMVLLFDKYLSRLDGLVLIILFVIYLIFSNWKKPKKAFYLLIPVSVLFFLLAFFLVNLAQKFATTYNLPLLLVGLLPLGVLTGLPELILETGMIKEKKAEIIFDNLIGSIVANGTLVIGIVALISPFRIQAFDKYLLATLAFVIIFGVFYLFIRTKRRLDRWEGVVLVGLYLVFVLTEFIT